MEKQEITIKTDEKNHSVGLFLRGDWVLETSLDNREEVFSLFEKQVVSQLHLDGEKLAKWDSQLIAFLVRIVLICQKKEIQCDLENFPKGVESLLKLALSVPEKKAIISEEKKEDFLTRLGLRALDLWQRSCEVFSFFGQISDSFARFFKRKAVVRSVDVFSELQEAGPNSLGIVSLICFLVGLILAFVGSLQLKMFGAQIYVSSLVAVSITRVMGAIMAGVIVAGRTGASYAATLGSMQVNEEIDALKTMGISPFDFLVLPRIFALCVMMPLLTIYADLMGILGGALVGIFMLDLSAEEYLRMTLEALSMKTILIGIIHGASFGVIIAICGCYQGIKCGRNASAVGVATTSAVVYSIVFMTLATAFLTYLFSLAGL